MHKTPNLKVDGLQEQKVTSGFTSVSQEKEGLS